MFELFSFIRDLFCFTGSYSNDCFLEPLSEDLEEKYILEKDVCRESRNKLIEHNLRLVAHIVKKYDSSLVSCDELISIGTIGLIKGVDSFSPDKGIKLTTYCARCIENEILMFFRSNNKYSRDVSMNEAIGYDKEGNKITIIDVLKTPNVDFLDESSKADDIKLISKYLDVLTEREKSIIIDRYGLNNKKSLTQNKLASKLGISRSYVSRIEKRALAKILKEFIKNNKV